MIRDYEKFIALKKIKDIPTGFEPEKFHSHLFDFQSDITRWACRRGRAALFEDCGLGKTPQQLAWAEQVARKTNLPVLGLAPLCVTKQTQREGEKFGIKVNLATEQTEIKSGVNYTNYEKLHHFDASQFGGIVLDESSILKSFDGATRNLVIESFAKCPYKLACTATPAPNDFMELGNHAEFLGVMSRTEMLATFFVHDGGETAKWRLKGHAEQDFWKWICSWAVNIRRPSDLGYKDGKFKLPALNLVEHVVESSQKMDGYLFALPASSLAERRDARRNSIDERVELCYELVLNELTIKAATPKSLHGKLSPSKPPEVEAFAIGSSQSKLCTTVEIQNRQSISGQSKIGSESIPDKESRKSKASENLGQIRDNAGTSKSDDGKAGASMCDLRVSRNPKRSQDVSIDRPLSQNGEVQGDSLSALQLCDRPPEGQRIISSGGSLLSSEKWLIWCELNKEQEMLKRVFGKLCVSIQGSTPDEERIEMEEEWRLGSIPILISKPSIFGFGMNWQHCHNVVFIGLSDSYETFYQAIRRCWRFGQTSTVSVHLIISNLEGAVLKNIKRKEADAMRMADEMLKNMASISSKEIKGLVRETETYNPQMKMELPKFL